MGCPVSTDVAKRSGRGEGGNETHPDGRPLSDISEEEDRLARTKTLARLGGDIEEKRNEVVPNIEEELFNYGDFKVVKTRTKKQHPNSGFRAIGPTPEPTPIRPVGVAVVPDGTVTTNVVDSAAAAKGKKEMSKTVWGEFTMPLIDEVDSDRRSAATTQRTVESPTSPGSPLPRPRPVVPRPGYKTIDKFVVRNAIGHGSRVKCIAIAPGEKEYVSCSNEDTSIAMFSLQNGRELGMFTGHQDTIINATFSYDGKYLATTSRDHTMILWDVVTTKQILTFEHGKVVICCCFSKDSKFVATGCQDKVCRVWETRKGREVLIFAQHEGIIISMCYAPDNSHIVSASADKTLRVWSSTTGRCKHLLQGHAGIVLSCVYTADGKRIISNDEKLLRVWNANDGTCTLSLSVDDVAKVPKSLAANSAQRKVTWTLSTACPGDFGNYLIVASNNRFVYILNAETGEEVTSHFCKAPVYCLAMGHINRAAVGDSFGNIYHFTFLSHQPE